MTPSRIFRGSTRRERIITLAKSLSDNVESVTLEEIDGEFFWRIVHSELFEPLTQYAATVAPYLVGAPPSERFDDAQRREIVQFENSALTDPRLDAETRQFALDTFKDQLRERQLKTATQNIISRLPLFVWTRFRNGQRIPLREPLEVFFLEGGKAMEIRIYSRIVSGDDLEGFLNDHHRGRLNFRPDLDSAVAEEARARVIAEVSTPPSSRVEVQVAFELVQSHERSSVTEVPTSLEIVPFLHVIMPRPLPPPGYLGPAYDTFVRERQQQMQQLFPGKATSQEKTTAIGTWAVALLMNEPMNFFAAREAMELGTDLWVGSKPPGQTWFRKSRDNLLMRVPEAEDYLFSRRRRSKRNTAP